MYYLNQAYRDYLQATGIQKVESEEDEAMAAYMQIHHPRFYDLVHVYGSPLNTVNLKNEGTNIASSSAKIEFVNMLGDNGKNYTKKMLLTMTLTDLKGIVSKLFKMDVLDIQLSYKATEDQQEYELTEDHRQLSFYSMAEETKIFVRSK